MAQSIRAGNRVRVVRDIVRREGPYASENEEGVVEETFVDARTVYSWVSPKKLWHAKVRFPDGSLRTFRLTSLERID